MAKYDHQRKMSKEERRILTKARFATVSKFVAEMAPMLFCNWQGTKNQAAIRKKMTSNANRELRDSLNVDFREWREPSDCKARFVPYEGANIVIPCELRIAEGKLEPLVYYNNIMGGFTWKFFQSRLRIADVFEKFGIYRHVIMIYYYAMLPNGTAKKGTIWLATCCREHHGKLWGDALWDDVAVECYVDGDAHFNMAWPLNYSFTLADIVPECARLDAPNGVGAMGVTTGGHFVITKVPSNYLKYMETLAQVGEYSFLVDPTISGALLGLIPFYGGAATFSHVFHTNTEFEIAKDYFPNRFSRANMRLFGHKYIGSNIYDVLDFGWQ